MTPNPRNLLNILELSNPLIGFYDTPKKSLFEPFTIPKQCIFSGYQDWMQGKSTCLSKLSVKSIECSGAGYWNCNISSVPKEHEYIVIGPLRMEQYEYIKTITFYVNPDQLSLLITGAEYHNAAPLSHLITTAFGTGCGQLAAIFDAFNTPKAAIGGTDIAMRPYLPRNTLAFTVTKPMFEILCQLDENSFLHKSFLRNVKQTRRVSKSHTTTGYIK